jgi:ketosteroid isomerase-like protein
MTNKEKSIAFSNGEFDAVYDCIAPDAVWTVVEENTFTGKNAILANCKEVSSYFASVTTQFETLNVIAENDKVVVNGTAAFFSDKKQLAFVSACDVYEFNSKGQILKITSYCIEKKADQKK